MLDKKKVLIIGPHPPNIGGVCTCIDTIEEGLKNDFDFIKYNTTGKKFKIIYKVYKLLKYPFTLIRQKPEVVHIHTPSDWAFWYNIALLQISKTFGIKTILHIHGGAFDKYYNTSKHKSVIRKAINSADKVIVLSEYWRKFFKKICDEEKIVIIPNSVSIPKAMSSLTTKNVLFVGSDWKRKGVLDIITAAKKVIREVKEVKFLIAGEDDNLDLDKIIKENKLTNNILLLGNIIGKVKEQTFLKASVYILPSYNENLPITLLEAMSYGIPTISCNVGGIPEIVDNNKTGFIINPGDHMALAEKIITLLNDSNMRKRLGLNSRIKAEKEYDTKKNIIKIKNIYNE